jgi:hypothetical protein
LLFLLSWLFAMGAVAQPVAPSLFSDMRWRLVGRFVAAARSPQSG